MTTHEWAGAGIDWSTPDPSACPVCHSEMCEDETHWAPPWWSAPDDGGTTSESPSPPALMFQSAEAVMQTPPPVEVVEGVAFADGITVLVAESGAGKTFVTLDMAAHVTADITWHRRAVQHGSVAYLSFEGDALGLRLQALREAGHRLEHLYVLRASEPLSPVFDRDRGERPSRGERVVADALDALVAGLEAVQRPTVALLVVDTVRASLAGSEDSSENVAAYVRAVRRLLRHVPGAAAVLTHHAGWQDGDTKRKRERGSSAFRGNVEATVYLEAEAYDQDTGTARLKLHAFKSRDTEKLPPLHLLRRRVELRGSNGRGEPLTSCVIDHDRRTREEREAEEAQAVETEHRETDLAVLRAMRDYPEATSISRLRVRVGLRTEAVSDAVGRILRAGWADEGKRGEPYQLTEAGRTALEDRT